MKNPKIIDEHIKILKKYSRYKNWWFKVEILASTNPILWISPTEASGYLSLDEAIKLKEKYEKSGEKARIVLHEKKHILHKRS